MVDDQTLLSGAATSLVASCDADPRVVALGTAVARLWRELAGYRAHLFDRVIAEDELAAVAADAAAGTVDTAGLRRSLLVITGALGSVSALAGAVAEVRRAIDLFGGGHSGFSGSG